MIVYAHRGSSERHPENTLEAFAAAIAEGADGIETDLRLTFDKQIVLLHDQKIAGLAASETSLADLSKRAVMEGYELATLPELLELARGRVALNLEIKDPSVVPHLVALPDVLGSALFTSFDVRAIENLRELAPNAKAGFVFDRWSGTEAALVRSFLPYAVSLKKSRYSPEALKICHDAGAKLLLWVVNDPVRAAEFAAMGVDGIFTDAPDRVPGAGGRGGAA